MATTEKLSEEPQHPPGYNSNKDEAHDLSSYDVVSSDKADDEVEKKDGGSMRDYIVSAQILDIPVCITTFLTYC